MSNPPVGTVVPPPLASEIRGRHQHRHKRSSTHRSSRLEQPIIDTTQRCKGHNDTSNPDPLTRDYHIDALRKEQYQAEHRKRAEDNAAASSKTDDRPSPWIKDLENEMDALMVPTFPAPENFLRYENAAPVQFATRRPTSHHSSDAGGLDSLIRMAENNAARLWYGNPFERRAPQGDGFEMAGMTSGAVHIDNETTPQPVKKQKTVVLKSTKKQAKTRPEPVVEEVDVKGKGKAKQQEQPEPKLILPTLDPGLDLVLPATEPTVGYWEGRIADAVAACRRATAIRNKAAAAGAQGSSSDEDKVIGHGCAAAKDGAWVVVRERDWEEEFVVVDKVAVGEGIWDADDFVADVGEDAGWRVLEMKTPRNVEAVR